VLHITWECGKNKSKIKARKINSSTTINNNRNKNKDSSSNRHKIILLTKGSVDWKEQMAARTRNGQIAD